MADDRDRYFFRIDRNVTVGYHKGDVREVAVCILKLIRRNTHHRGSRIGSFSLSRTA